VHRPLLGHDRAPAEVDQDPTQALGQAVERLRIGGALFLRARYTEGWASRTVPMKDLGRFLAPGAERVLAFHVVVSGRCWFDVGNGRRWAEAGDVALFPYGQPHTMGGVEDAEVVDAGRLVAAPPWDQMPYIEHGEGGPETQVVCGYLTSDEPLFDPDLRALPPIIVVRPTGAAADWVRISFEYALQQTQLHDGARASTPPGLVRQLLVEVLKLHLASAPATETGFIKALHDPVLAPALAQIHADPGTKWTVSTLAEAANVSPSLLDERFRTVLAMPPIRYLTTWRMHVAQDMLSSSDLGVGAIAHQVGYESEEAFSRAFKRKHGLPPGAWRSR
jgi:AraC-like DNA-binding protein